MISLYFLTVAVSVRAPYTEGNTRSDRIAAPSRRGRRREGLVVFGESTV